MSDSHDHDHHHDHDHAHGEDEPVGARHGIDEGLDPANQSLADALRVSFWILKTVMILLAVAFLGWSRHSGFFTVPPQKQAMVLRFGAISGPGVPKDPGRHWSWPYPVESREMVDVRVKSLEIDTFFFRLSERDKTKTLDEMPLFAMGSLAPGQDGCLISGDRNLLHALWSVEYQVTDVRQYLENVQDEQKIVKAVLDNAVLRTVAQYKADDLLGDRISLIQTEVARRVAKRLTELETGITVLSVNVKMPTPPLPVRGAFLAVNEAVSEADQKVLEASREAEKALNDMAGPAHKKLGTLVEKYEEARQRGDKTVSEAVQHEIDALLVSNETKGKAGLLIDAARSFQTGTIEQVRGDARYFRDLRAQLGARPDTVLRQLWDNTKQRMLDKAEAKVYMMAGEPLIIDLNKPARWDMADKKARLEAEGKKK